jgi:hypothetical protein
MQIKHGPNEQASAKILSLSLLSSLLLSFSILVTTPSHHAMAANLLSTTDTVDIEGISAVTQSDLGQSVRRGIVGGARFADRLDQTWQRFSDSLRDQEKCDPVTNRRLFDNGFRRDGTRIGNPVLGALCDPVPLRTLDVRLVNVVLGLAEETAVDILGEGNRALLRGKVDTVKHLVGPAFSRAAEEQTTTLSEEESLERTKRQTYNMDIYARMRAYGEVLNQKKQGGALRETARKFDASWGQKMMASLAPIADRNDFTSPFPAPDRSDELPYDEGALLDALGAVSATLNTMQEGGLIGHWEISIPEDDYGNVVTIAVDDDASIGAQVLSREQNQPLGGSAVLALVRSAMDDRAKISYNIDTFFIDPSTTKQELYNPTQVLISLSNLGVA